jgi:hypothetical protein
VALVGAVPELSFKGYIIDPFASPAKTAVFVVLSIRDKFCPGCARIRLSPLPVESKNPSNCHKFKSDAVKLELTVATLHENPDPVPPMLAVAADRVSPTI